MRIAILATAQTFGGIQMLTIRFSEYLKSKGISFFLITNEGTRISKALSWAEQAKLSDLGTSDFNPTHILFPHVSGLKAAVPWGNIAKTKVLVWAVHPTEVFTTFFPGSEFILRGLGFACTRFGARLAPARKVVVNALFELLCEKDALIAMDAATSRGIRYFYTCIPKNLAILPIPCPVSFEQSARRTLKVAKSELSLAYFGRMDYSKYTAIKNVITRDLRWLARKQDVMLHLITEGPFLVKLLKDCKESHIQTRTYGFLDNYEARKLVSERTHLAMAMGTAALDIAAIGHPCIIIDPAHRHWASPQETFRFVSEVDGFTLGEYRDFPGYQSGLHTFEQALMLVRDKNTIGYDCLKYVHDNHNPEAIFKLLIKNIESSALLAFDVGRYAKKIADLN